MDGVLLFGTGSARRGECVDGSVLFRQSQNEHCQQSDDECDVGPRH